jgi:CHASE1-domain containing sensor protein
VTALWARGLLQAGEIPFSWWTWWVGDVIGVAVVAPLVLIGFGRPRDVWRRRSVPVAIPLAVLLVLAASLFLLVSAWERARIATGFKVRSDALAAAVRARLEESAELLRSLESFHAAAPQFDRRTFRSFVERALSKSPHLQALSWNPRVTDAGREAFEQGGPDGSDGACRITERDSKDRLVPAPRRSEYVPVRYIEPYEANAAIVGFDVSSGIVRFEAMKQACETGAPAATRRIRLLQEAEPAFGLLVFLPVYSKSGSSATPEDRRRSVAGYFAGVLRLQEFFSFLDGARNAEGIDVEVRDGDAPAGGDALRPSSLDRTGPAEIQHTATFAFGGRNWSAICRATPAYVAAARSWKPWGVLAAGMGAAGFLGAFLLAATGRAVLIERSRTGS